MIGFSLHAVAPSREAESRSSGGIAGSGPGGYGGRRRCLSPAQMALLVATLLVVAQGCGNGESAEEARRAAVVAALDSLAADLLEDRPADAAAYIARLETYLEAHPSFFGSAAALLDRSGAVIASPYVYRTDDGYANLDLAAPSYNIEAQDWFTLPLTRETGTWTDPYFDAGGGEVWMITRSVPVADEDGVFAVITTDLTVDAQ